MTASFELERSIPVQRVDPPLPPGWIVAILGEDAKEFAVSGARDPAVTVTESTDFSFLRVRASNLRNLADDAFRSAVRRTYTSIVTLLDERHLFPLRVWNHIPGILDPASGGLHRYEHFNAGRFDAYREYHGHECFGEWSPSASAVGCGGDDLMIDLLAGSDPGGLGCRRHGRL